jgi:GNAT superfamily N-acetyltransferase
MTPDALTALCAAAMPDEHLTASELEYLCFGADDTVLGDETGAAVVQSQRFGDVQVAWLTLVVVDPAAQGKGRGTALVHAALDQAKSAGARELLLASAIPRYLWPGVDLTNTRAGMLFEACEFERLWIGTNMAIDTSFRRDAPRGVVVEQETTNGAHDFAAHAYPHWVPELDRAVSLGTAFAARDSQGATIGFGCHSVNRAGWIGPMATDPDAQNGGVGSALVSAVCADLAQRGHTAGEIAWVSNLRFYGKCGATVSRVFLGGRRNV